MMYSRNQRIKQKQSRSVACAIGRRDGSGLKFVDNRDNRRSLPLQRKSSSDARVVQRKSVPGVAGFGNYMDLGNGLFGTDKVTRASEVSGLVNEIRSKAAAVGIHQNIKVLTGTHGSSSGHLVGETKFYNEDLAHEGHKVSKGGWINVLDVIGQSKESIGGWMTPGSSAIILAWCFSKMSAENWENVHCYKTGADAKKGKKVW